MGRRFGFLESTPFWGFASVAIGIFASVASDIIKPWLVAIAGIFALLAIWTATVDCRSDIRTGLRFIGVLLLGGSCWYVIDALRPSLGLRVIEQTAIVVSMDQPGLGLPGNLAVSNNRMTPITLMIYPQRLIPLHPGLQNVVTDGVDLC
jgi:hypothetical protein